MTSGEMRIIIVKETPEYWHAFSFGQRLAELLRNGDQWYVNPCVEWIDCACLPENKIRDHIKKCFDRNVAGIK